MTVENGQSIVHSPWDFACQWYAVDDIHRCITSKVNPAFGGTVDIPKDITSREFAEWLAGEYRLAMRKGAELAIREMQDRINESEREDRRAIAEIAAKDKTRDQRAQNMTTENGQSSAPSASHYTSHCYRVNYE